jgi:hypothetical protein
MEQIDTDEGGTVNLDEFRTWLQSDKKMAAGVHRAVASSGDDAHERISEGVPPDTRIVEMLVREVVRSSNSELRELALTVNVTQLHMASSQLPRVAVVASRSSGEGELRSSTTLSSVLRPSVHLFRSYPPTKVGKPPLPPDQGFTGMLWQSGRATSANQNHFDVCKIAGSAYADGSTVAFNPTMLAMEEAMDYSDCRIGCIVSIGGLTSKDCVGSLSTKRTVPDCNEFKSAQHTHATVLEALRIGDDGRQEISSCCAVAEDPRHARCQGTVYVRLTPVAKKKGKQDLQAFESEAHMRDVTSKWLDDKNRDNGGVADIMESLRDWLATGTKPREDFRKLEWAIGHEDVFGFPKPKD